MKVLDKNQDETLYKLENDIFDTVVLECADGECYVLTDMQGEYPTSLDECAEYDWVNAEEVDY